MITEEIKRTLNLMGRMGLVENTELILEAMSVDDVYAKYYSNVNREDFNQIVKADPTTPENGSKTGKFVKWLLSLYTSNNLKLEDLYKANEYLNTYIKFFNKVPQEYKDINKIKSLPELFNVIKEFLDNPEQATSKSDERRKIKENEAEVFYEDSVWKVIIPKTEAAACEYGKNTQWCTAATSSDNMFNYYNNRSPLYVLINKQNHKKYQFHFESKQFMDSNDVGIYPREIGLTRDLWVAFQNSGELIIDTDFSNFNMEMIDNFIIYSPKLNGGYITTSIVNDLNTNKVYIIKSYGLIRDSSNNSILGNLYNNDLFNDEINKYLLSSATFKNVVILGDFLVNIEDLLGGVYSITNIKSNEWGILNIFGNYLKIGERKYTLITQDIFDINNILKLPLIDEIILSKNKDCYSFDSKDDYDLYFFNFKIKKAYKVMCSNGMLYDIMNEIGVGVSEVAIDTDINLLNPQTLIETLKLIPRLKYLYYDKNFLIVGRITDRGEQYFIYKWDDSNFFYRMTFTSDNVRITNRDDEPYSYEYIISLGITDNMLGGNNMK